MERKPLANSTKPRTFQKIGPITHWSGHYNIGLIGYKQDLVTEAFLWR